MKQWYKHDVDASEDALMLRIRSKFGHAGYGLWWLIVEQLYRHDGELDVSEYDTLAYAIRVSAAEVEDFVKYAESIGLVSIGEGSIMTNERVTAAIVERRSKSDMATKAVQSRYERSTNVEQTKSERTTDVLQNKSKNKRKKKSTEEEKNTQSVLEIDDGFDAFWNLYGKKIDPRKCRALWSRLTPAERQSVMQHLPRYVASTPDVQYRRNPQTYLNNRTWESDIAETRHASNAATHPAISRHIPADQLIDDDIDRRRRLGLDDEQDDGRSGTHQGASPLVLGPALEAGSIQGNTTGRAREEPTCETTEAPRGDDVPTGARSDALHFGPSPPG